MTGKPIQCGEPFAPVLMVVFRRERDGRLLADDTGATIACAPDAADMRALLQSLTPEERAEVVGSEADDAWQSVSSERAGRIEAEEKLHAAIARAEAAERERDEAKAESVRYLRVIRGDDSPPEFAGLSLAETRAELRSLRSDLERTAKVVEAAKVFNATPVNTPAWFQAYSDLRYAVNALTAPAAEATKAEPPPDPNEREELGRMVREVVVGDQYRTAWDGLPESVREAYCNAASAVAAHVRRDGRSEP